MIKLNFITKPDPGVGICATRCSSESYIAISSGFFHNLTIRRYNQTNCNN